MTTAQLSRLIGAPLTLLQHWDEGGVIVPRRRPGHHGGLRQYEPRQVFEALVLRALRLKRVPFRLAVAALRKIKWRWRYLIVEGNLSSFENREDRLAARVIEARRPVVVVDLEALRERCRE